MKEQVLMVITNNGLRARNPSECRRMINCGGGSPSILYGEWGSYGDRQTILLDKTEGIIYAK